MQGLQNRARIDLFALGGVRPVLQRVGGLVQCYVRLSNNAPTATPKSSASLSSFGGVIRRSASVVFSTMVFDGRDAQADVFGGYGRLATP